MGLESCNYIRGRVIQFIKILENRIINIIFQISNKNNSRSYFKIYNMFSKMMLVAYFVSIFLLLSSNGLPRQNFLLFATAQEEDDD